MQTRVHDITYLKHSSLSLLLELDLHLMSQKAKDPSLEPETIISVEHKKQHKLFVIV